MKDTAQVVELLRRDPAPLPYPVDRRAAYAVLSYKGIRALPSLPDRSPKRLVTNHYYHRINDNMPDFS